MLDCSKAKPMRVFSLKKVLLCLSMNLFWLIGVVLLCPKATLYRRVSISPMSIGCASVLAKVADEKQQESSGKVLNDSVYNVLFFFIIIGY